MILRNDNFIILRNDNSMILRNDNFMILRNDNSIILKNDNSMILRNDNCMIFYDKHFPNYEIFIFLYHQTITYCQINQTQKFQWFFSDKVGWGCGIHRLLFGWDI